MMEAITRRALELWQKVPTDEVGTMPHSYDIRATLSREFPGELNGHIVNCSMAAVRMLKRDKPIDTAEKQSRRRAALDEIAQAAGWDSWDQYATAVKRGVVVIVARPNQVLQPTTPEAKTSKSRRSGRGG